MEHLFVALGIIALACTFPFRVTIPDVQIVNDQPLPTSFEGNHVSCVDCNPLVFGQRIALNCASAEQLEKLDKIGPALAKRIVDYRSINGDFQTLEELDLVKGIGPKTLQIIANQIAIQPSDTCAARPSSAK